MGKMVRGPDQRARVRGALIDLCFERGYRQVSLPVLLERADVDEPNFHRHFADLEDCFCQVYLELREEFLEMVAQAIRGQPSWRDRIRAAAYAMVRYLLEDERATHFGVFEVRSAGERAQLLLAELFEILFDLIDEGREGRDDLGAVSRTTAESIGGGIFNEIFTAVAHGAPLSEEIIPQMMYVAVEPYLGHEAALQELRIPPPPPPATEALLASRRGYPFSVSAQGKGEESEAQSELGPLPGGHHGLTREQVAESQRERLLAAVAHTVAERGYRATTITDIVKAASVSSRVFYEHFSSKEECFLAAFEAVLGHLEELIQAAVEPYPDWPQRVIASLRAALRFFDAEPDLARLCLLEPITATPASAVRFRELVLAAIPLLEVGRAERPDGSSLPESTEDSLLGGLITLTSRSILAESESLEALLPDLVDFVLSPYLGPETAKKLAAEAESAPEPRIPRTT